MNTLEWGGSRAGQGLQWELASLSCCLGDKEESLCEDSQLTGGDLNYKGPKKARIDSFV